MGPWEGGRVLFFGVIDWDKANSVLLDGIFQNHLRIVNWNSLGYVSNFVIDFFYFYGCYYHYIVVILWSRTFLILLVRNFSFTTGWCYLYPMKSQGYLKDVNVWRMINIRQRSWVLRNCLTYLSLNLPFLFLFIPATISYLPQWYFCENFWVIWHKISGYLTVRSIISFHIKILFKF